MGQSSRLLEVGDEEAARLLGLAAGQRMNTDARRAVFVAVMGAADVVDAFERTLRLPLKVTVSLSLSLSKRHLAWFTSALMILLIPRQRQRRFLFLSRWIGSY